MTAQAENNEAYLQVTYPSGAIMRNFAPLGYGVHLLTPVKKNQTITLKAERVASASKSYTLYY